MPPNIENNPLFDEINRRRGWFLWLLIGWMIAGFGLMLTVSLSQLFLFVLNAILPMGWLVIASEIKNLPCPRCGGKALSKAPLFTMDNVCCQWCNYPGEDKRENETDLIGDQWKLPEKGN